MSGALGGTPPNILFFNRLFLIRQKLVALPIFEELFTKHLGNVTQFLLKQPFGNRRSVRKKQLKEFSTWKFISRKRFWYSLCSCSCSTLFLKSVTMLNFSSSSLFVTRLSSAQATARRRRERKKDAKEEKTTRVQTSKRVAAKEARKMS